MHKHLSAQRSVNNKSRQSIQAQTGNKTMTVKQRNHKAIKRNISNGNKTAEKIQQQKRLTCFYYVFLLCLSIQVCLLIVMFTLMRLFANSICHKMNTKVLGNIVAATAHVVTKQLLGQPRTNNYGEKYIFLGLEVIIDDN